MKFDTFYERFLQAYTETDTDYDGSILYHFRDDDLGIHEIVRVTKEEIEGSICCELNDSTLMDFETLDNDLYRKTIIELYLKTITAYDGI